MNVQLLVCSRRINGMEWSEEVRLELIDIKRQVHRVCDTVHHSHSPPLQYPPLIRLVQDEVLCRYPSTRRWRSRCAYACKYSLPKHCFSSNMFQPGIPSASSARSLLSGLAVAAPTNTGTYDRDLFPHWETYEGACNTR